MKTKIIIVLASLAAVLAGCKDFRPGVPEAYWDYFPYEVGDSISFSNGTEEMGFRIRRKSIEKDCYVKHRFIQRNWQPHVPEMSFGSDDTPRTERADLIGWLSVYDLNEAELIVILDTKKGKYSKHWFCAQTLPNELPSEIVLHYQGKDTVSFKTATVKKGVGVTSFSEYDGTVWSLKEN